MSAYVNRLIQRFSAGPSEAHPGLEPSLRSASPIAAIDQRLGVAEQLGHGFGGPEEPAFGQPWTTKPASEPLGAEAPSSVDGRPWSEAPVPRERAAAVDGAANGDEGSAEPSSPRPRPTPLDPPDLFAPPPDDFGELAVRAEPSSHDDARSSQAGFPERAEHGGERMGPVSSSDRPRASSGERRPVAPVAPLDLATIDSSPEVESEAQAPWQRVEAFSDVAARKLDVVLEPQPAPSRLADLEPDRRPRAQLYLLPTPPAPEPFVPEAQPRPEPQAEPAASQRATSTPETQANSQTRAETSRPRERAPRPPLTIDSVSLIGPLDRLFPSRRRFRMRYR